MEDGRFTLNRPEPALQRRSLGGGRMLFRALMIVAILWLATYRGLTLVRAALLGVAILWALALPSILRWITQATARRPAWQRYVLVGLTALLLLGAFALGVQPLVTG